MHETYRITTSSPFIPPQPQDTWTTTGRFDAFNNFHGAQLGVRARHDRGRWFVDGALKLPAPGAAPRAAPAVTGSAPQRDF